MYTCTVVDEETYIYVNKKIYLNTHMYIYIFIYICTHTYMCLRRDIPYIHIYVYIYMYIYIYAVVDEGNCVRNVSIEILHV